MTLARQIAGQSLFARAPETLPGSQEHGGSRPQKPAKSIEAVARYHKMQAGRQARALGNFRQAGGEMPLHGGGTAELGRVGSNINGDKLQPHIETRTERAGP